MKRIFITLGVCMIFFSLMSQPVPQRVQKAFKLFEADSQLKHAVISLYIINASSGKIVFDRNSRLGLAGASTQKVFTAAAALESLGKDFNYTTTLGYDGQLNDGILNGNLYITGSGDPTLGSWRFVNNAEEVVLNGLAGAIINNKISKVNGDIFMNTPGWGTESIPDGWIWEDLGNYYGAGATGLNWRENQYDLVLQSGIKVGDPVIVQSTIPTTYGAKFISELKSAPKNSGDNAYIYLPVPVAGTATSLPAYYVRGTIPLGEKAFKISGSMVDPGRQLKFSLLEKLSGKTTFTKPSSNDELNLNPQPPSTNIKSIFTINSPALDSIIYWFLQKSINLYGEALVKTISYRKVGIASTAKGISEMKDFWKQKGIDKEELNIYDGSGLSPLNRITTHAQVSALKYAKAKDWFPYFFAALPEFNGMKMKSGTINDVKGFCGYHRSKDGQEYIFSFLVNNYSGPTSTLVNKMYRVLDKLK